jgi:hypothetical protein
MPAMIARFTGAAKRNFRSAAVQVRARKMVPNIAAGL